MAIYYTIEIDFNHDGARKTHRMYDRSAAELMAFRKAVFLAGFFYPVDAYGGEVINPADILKVYVKYQTKQHGPPMDAANAAAAGITANNGATA